MVCRPAGWGRYTVLPVPDREGGTLRLGSYVFRHLKEELLQGYEELEYALFDSGKRFPPSI